MADSQNDMINFSPYDIVVNNATCENTQKYMQELRFAELKKIHRDPLLLPYIMSADDTQIFNKLLGTRYAVLKDRPSTNPHAILANLTSIAYQRITQYAKNFKSCVDIGGTPLRTPKNHHIDVLINTSRDEARYLNANIIRPESQLANLHNEARGALCINGAQNCNYQAEYGYMVNVYDISLETVTEIMNVKNMQVLDVWMFLPLILSDINNNTDQTYYTCNVTKGSPKDNGKQRSYFKCLQRRTVSFALNDSSNLYRHDYENWRKFLTTTLIRGKRGAAIVLEHVETFGTFTNIRFIKTWCKAGVVERYFPMDKIMKNYVMMPSITAFIEAGRWISTKDISIIQRLKDSSIVKAWHDDRAVNYINGAVYRDFYIVEENFVESVRNYGNSLKKEAFTFEAVLAYCNTKRTSVVYERNSKVVMVHKGLSATTNIYTSLCMDLFLQCAIDRYNRTQKLSNSIKKIHDIKGFWANISESLKQWWFDLWHTHKDAMNIIETQEFTGRVLDLRPMYYKPLIYCGVVTVDVIQPHYRAMANTNTVPTIIKGSSITTPSITPIGVTDIDDDEIDNTTIQKEATTANSKPAVNESANISTKITVKLKTKTAVDENATTTKMTNENITAAKDTDVKDNHKPTVNNADKLSNTHSTHGRLVPVPGAGQCALHSLAYYGYKEFKSISKKDLKKGWLNDVQITQLCREHNISWTKHINSKPIWTFECGTSNHINLNFTGPTDAGHWEPILCNCSRATATEQQSYIGKYINVPEGDDVLYVNCANNNLSDGSGQALDFRNKFPNYDVKMKKPVDIIQFTRYQKGKHNLHLCCAVAHNNTNNYDLKLTISTYKEIIKRIDGYCYNNDLTVYLPLIGTAIFGGNVCCLKRVISTMQCKKVMCFLDKKQMDQYNELLPCNHGGGDILAWSNGNAALAIQGAPVENPFYKQLMFENIPTSMPDKIDDIIDMILPRKDQRIMEMSGAPGNFKKMYPNIIAGWYKPGMPFTKAKHDFEYDDTLSFVDNMPKDIHHVINDNPITNDNVIEETYKLNMMIQKYKNLITYTFKCVPCDTELDISLLTARCQGPSYMYRNSGSKSHSGEIYVTVLFGDRADKVSVKMSKDSWKTRMLYTHPAAKQIKNDWTHGNLSAAVVNPFEIMKEMDEITYWRQEGKIQPMQKFEQIEFTNSAEEYKQEHRKKKVDKPTIVKFEETRQPEEIKQQPDDIKPTFDLPDNDVFNITPEESKTNECGHNMEFFKANAKIKATVHKADIQQLLTQLQDDKCIGKATKEELSNIEVPDTVDIACDADVGVGGAGKTMSIVKNTCNKCIMMISPYREQKSEVNIIQGNGYCSTYIVALNNIGLRKSPIVILDEIYVHNFTMIAVYQLLAKSRGVDLTFYGTGDNKQITSIDWNGTLTKPTTEFVTPYRTETKRNPQSVVDLCKDYVPGITTTNKHKNPIIWKKPSEAKEIQPYSSSLSEVILCFTKEMMNILQTTNKIKVLTVGMAHGKTFENVHLYSTDISQINAVDRAAQMYTGISRTSRQLIVYGEKGDLDVLTTLNGSALERALDTFDNQPQQAMVILEEPVKIKIGNDDNIRLKIPEVSTDIVVEVLNKVYKQVNELNPLVVDINPPTIPSINSDKKFKCSINMATPSDTSIVAKTLSKFKTYNRLYNNSSKRKGLSTFVGRYANRPVNKIDEKFQKLFVKGMEKFLKPNYVKIAERNKPTPEIIWKHTTDALKILQQKFPAEYRKVITEADEDWFKPITKEMMADAQRIIAENKQKDYQQRPLDYDVELVNIEASKREEKDAVMARTVIVAKFLNLVLDPNATVNKYQDLEREFTDEHEYHKQVSFHMKTQPKNIMDPGYDAKNKHGQGVSAWTKMANIVCAGHVRYFDWLLPYLVKDNVQISYNKSDKELSTFFMQFSDDLHNKGVTKFLNDFSEFDCSQEQRGIEAVFEIYRLTGMNKHTIEYMFSMRKNWTLFMRTEIKSQQASAILDGEWQQHSGQVHTLGSNTLYNMGAIGMCYNFKDIIAAAFKGDDCFILCNGYNEIVIEEIPISKHANYRMKVETPEIPEFIANIITPFGFVPDLIRRTSRIVSKTYNNKDDWEQIKLSTADSLSVLPEINLNVGMCYLQSYYLQHKIYVTVEDLTTLWFYLKKLTTSDVSILGTDRELFFLEEFNEFNQKH